MLYSSHQSGFAPPPRIGCCQCVDDYLLLCQTTHPQLGVFQQHPRYNGGIDQNPCLELGGEGIRFNSILPGWTKAERVTELLRARAQAQNTSVAAKLSKQIKIALLGAWQSRKNLPIPLSSCFRPLHPISPP